MIITDFIKDIPDDFPSGPVDGLIEEGLGILFESYGLDTGVGSMFDPDNWATDEINTLEESISDINPVNYIHETRRSSVMLFNEARMAEIYKYSPIDKPSKRLLKKESQFREKDKDRSIFNIDLSEHISPIAKAITLLIPMRGSISVDISVVILATKLLSLRELLDIQGIYSRRIAESSHKYDATAKTEQLKQEFDAKPYNAIKKEIVQRHTAAYIKEHPDADQPSIRKAIKPIAEEEIENHPNLKDDGGDENAIDEFVTHPDVLNRWILEASNKKEID